MPKQLDFTYDQPVQAVHADGSALIGRWGGDRIRMHGFDAWLIEGLERLGYRVVAARGTKVASTAQLQALPSGSVVCGNRLAAMKDFDGKWAITGRDGHELASNLWNELIEITVVHVPGGA